MKRGFTLLETMIVLAIVLIMGITIRLTLFPKDTKAALDSATQEIVATLRQAQGDAMTQNQGTPWGVHLDNVGARPFFALYASSSYASATIVASYPLPPAVGFTAGTISKGSYKEILFSEITGATSPATIGLYATGNSSLSSTITVATSGEVSY